MLVEFEKAYKAYLIRAFYQWAKDCHYEITMKIFAKDKNHVDMLPKKCLYEDGTAVIIFSNLAIKSLDIGNETIRFSVSVDEKNYFIEVGIDAIYWLRAKDVEEYLYLNDKDNITTMMTKNKTKEMKQEKDRKVGIDSETARQWINKSSRLRRQLNNSHLSFF